MGFRMSVKGKLAVDDSTRLQVVEVLEKRQLKYSASGRHELVVDHAERNMTPGDRRVDRALKDLSEVFEEPQTLTKWDEFSGEQEVAIGGGRIREEYYENVWSMSEALPSPEQVLERLRERGVLARLTKVQGRRGTTRQFEFQPGTGGPGCKVTVKRRFWDSFDLLSVPEMSKKLCDQHGLTAKQLRDRLHGSAFGLEVRNPAGGSLNTDILFEELMLVMVELTQGIRTTIG